MAFRVLSYNIRDGGEERMEWIMEVIRTQQPDAVALLEANSPSNAKTLANKLGMQLVYGQANSEFAVAWLSCLAIKRNRTHRLKALAKTLLEIIVVWKDIELSLFATHLIHGRTVTEAQHREMEVRAILEILRPLNNQWHLLVGDFNAVHPSDLIGDPPSGEKKGYIARYPIQLLLETGYVDCYRKVHAEVPGYTYPSCWPWLRLDYIFASPGMATRLCDSDVVTGWEAKKASDHFPIWAEFK
jgi:exodeoxyribonuclease-3